MENEPLRKSGLGNHSFTRIVNHMGQGLRRGKNLPTDAKRALQVGVNASPSLLTIVARSAWADSLVKTEVCIPKFSSRFRDVRMETGFVNHSMANLGLRQSLRRHRMALRRWCGSGKGEFDARPAY
jgi:hypothetical protein